MKNQVDLIAKGTHINDSFWTRYTRLIREVVIPYQWDALMTGLTMLNLVEHLATLGLQLVKKSRILWHGLQDSDVASG